MKVMIMEERMNKEQVIELIKSIDIDKEEFIVLSSGALVLRGIFDNAGDIDIAVTEKGLEQLKEKYDIKLKGDEWPGWYRINDKIECIVDDMENKKEKVGEYYLQDIFDYLDYMKSSKREKYIPRIELVEKYIKENY